MASYPLPGSECVLLFQWVLCLHIPALPLPTFCIQKKQTTHSTLRLHYVHPFAAPEVSLGFTEVCAIFSLTTRYIVIWPSGE